MLTDRARRSPGAAPWLSRAASLAALAVAVILAVSAFEHLRGSAELTAHYSAVALPGIGSRSIGLLQLSGAAGLLVPRTRRWAGLVVATVMGVVLVERLVRHHLMESMSLEVLGLLALALLASGWPRVSETP